MDTDREKFIDETERVIDQCFFCGDRKGAIEYALKHYGPTYISVIRRMLKGDLAASDDVKQVAWARVVEKINQYTGKGKFYSWIFSIMRNTTIDWQRMTTTARNRIVGDSSVVWSKIKQSVDEKSTNTTRVYLRSQAKVLREELSEDDRLLLDMVLFDNLSYLEVLQILTDEATFCSFSKEDVERECHRYRNKLLRLKKKMAAELRRSQRIYRTKAKSVLGGS